MHQTSHFVLVRRRITPSPHAKPSPIALVRFSYASTTTAKGVHIAAAREESECNYELDVCVPALCADVNDPLNDENVNIYTSDSTVSRAYGRRAG